MSQTTRCPKCSTVFKVSDAQLQVAKGKVRCGSCLNVFKAAEHWVDGAKPAAASKAAPPKAAVKPAAGKFQFDQSAIDGGSAESMLTKPEMPAVNTLGEMRAVAAKSPVEDDDDGDALIDDDDDALIDDGASTREQEALVSSGDDYSDLFMNLDDLGDNTEQYGSLDDELSTGDESWAKEMLDELEDKSVEIAARQQAVLNAGAKDNVFAEDGYKKKREGARDGFVSGNRERGDDDQVLRDLGLEKPPAPKKPLNKKDMLSRIEPGPVDIHWQDGARNLMNFLLWGGLSLLALLGLVIQYGWMNFDTLARESTWRPVYAQACQLIGCRLPDQFNPDAIRTSNLVVRLDPDVHYALAVDVMLQNTASYVQPFPELELYFSDINNFPIASRRFKPSEYLAGEMAGKREMPPAKSIHISMQIVDPGSAAVNYRLEVSEKLPTAN